jgi:hypothetical protein
LFLALFLPPALFAPVLAKRHSHRLDVLCSAHLSGFQVVVGKWLARSALLALLLLAAGVMLAMALLFGGVRREHLAAVLALAAGSAMLSSGLAPAVGLLSSRPCSSWATGKNATRTWSSGIIRCTSRRFRSAWTRARTSGGSTSRSTSCSSTPCSG